MSLFDKWFNNSRLAPVDNMDGDFAPHAIDYSKLTTRELYRMNDRPEPEHGEGWRECSAGAVTVYAYNSETGNTEVVDRWQTDKRYPWEYNLFKDVVENGT